MRGLKITPELAKLDPRYGKYVTAPDKGADAYQRGKALEEMARPGAGNLLSSDTITGMGEQTNYQSDVTNWWNSFNNSIDEIDKSNYSGKRKPYELKMDELSKEIEELESTHHPANIEKAKQKRRELAGIENDPEYQSLNEKIQQQEDSIANHPVDTDYSIEQARAQQEENSSMYDFLKYELPQELGGSASEIGTQLATAYGPKLINSLVKKAVVSAEAGPYAPAIMGALTVAEVGAGLYGLWKMRDNESDAEVNDAYEQNVANMTDELRASRGGIEPTAAELRDIRIQAHKGLDNVKAQNMNLMLGDALEVLTLGRFGVLEKFGEATRWGRLGKTIGGGIGTALAEGMEETDQYGIKAQYIAGKFKDEKGFGENFEQSIKHRLSSMEYTLTNTSGEGYEKDPEYRNAFRSGAILGGLMGGLGTAGKAYSDERQYYKTIADVKAMSPEMLKAAKADYRAKVYTKYFAQDKGNFLIEGLTNLVKTAKTAEEKAAMEEEVAKAIEGQHLYENLKKIHKTLSPEDLAKTYHKAQHLTSSIEDVQRNDNELAKEHIVQTNDLNKLSDNPTFNEAMRSRAKLDAIRQNLDAYQAMDENDKPSNIKEYEKILEDKYKENLVSYNQILENGNITEKEVQEKIDTIEPLTKVENARINNELVRSDLRGSLAHIHTSGGANYYLAGGAKAAPKAPEFELKDATVEDYKKHENQQLAKERIKARTNKIEREAFEKNIKSRLASDEGLENILEDVNTLSPKLGNTAASLLEQAVKQREEQNKREEAAVDSLTSEAYGARTTGQTLSEDKQNLLNELQAKDHSKFEKEAATFKQNVASLREEVKPVTENKIKRNIKESFFKGFNYIKDNFERNPEYSDIKSIDKEVGRLENLKKIYDERTDLDKTSKEFEGFEDDLNTKIDKLKEIQTEVENRIQSRELKDKAITKSQTRLVLNQVGLNPDKTVVEGKESLNEIVVSIVGDTEYKAVLDHSTEPELVHANILVQLLKDNMTDRTRIDEAIKNAKATFIAKIKALAMVSPIATGNVFKRYVASPDTTFSDLINSTKDGLSGAIDTKKGGAVYTFLKEKDIAEFISNVEKEDRGNSRITKEALLELINLHLNYASLFELERNLDSEQDITTLTVSERDLERAESEKTKRETPTPSNQQSVSIRQLYRFVKTKSTGSELFDNVAYLKGYAGTGKTTVVIRWVMKLLGLNLNEIYTAGHNEHSAKGIAASLKKTTAHTAEDLLADIPNMDDKIKVIILDEAPGVNDTVIENISKALQEKNKTRKEPIKMIMMGDPNQRVAGGGKASIDSSGLLPGLKNVTHVTPLTIRFRTDVAPIVDVQDLFIDQSEDLTKTTLHVKGNTVKPSTFSSSLLGVNGSKNNFDADVVAILTARKDDTSRTRAIIVGNEADVQKYEALLAANGITGVPVMTDINAQGRTIDEVYVNIPYSKAAYRTMNEYNTAMYTATSRAAQYLYVGSFDVDNNLSDKIEDNKAKREQENKERSEKFVTQKEKELKTIDEFIDEVAAPPTKAEVEAKVEETEEPAKTEEPTGDGKEAEIVDETNGDVEVQEDYDSQKEYVEVREEVDFSNPETIDVVEKKPEVVVVVAPEGKVDGVAYPTGASVAILNQDGTYGPGIKAGDEVHYVKVPPKKAGHEATIMIVAPVEGKPGVFYEVGVVSLKEIEDGLANEDTLYQAIQEAKNEEDEMFSSFNKSSGGTITQASPIKPIFSGKIAHAQKLTYKYGKEYRGFNMRDIVTRFINNFFTSLTDKEREGIIKSSVIRIYNDQDITQLEKDYEKVGGLPFTPSAGVPYLVLSKLEKYGSPKDAKLQFIRLTPAKLNNIKHKELTEPIEKLINAIERMQQYLGDVAEFGTPEYGQIIRATDKYMANTLRAKLPSVTDENFAAFNELRKEIHDLVYTKKLEYFKGEEAKTIKRGYHVVHNVEEKAFEGTGRVEDIILEGKTPVSAIVKDENGNKVTIPYEELIRVAVDKRSTGPAQHALNAIAKSNKEINGVPLRVILTIPKSKGTGTVKVTNAKGLLVEKGQTFSLAQLKAIMSFDAEGNSTGYVPLNIEDFTDKGNNIANIEDYVTENFDEVLPSSISVHTKSAKKEKSVPTPAPKLPELVPTRTTPTESAKIAANVAKGIENVTKQIKDVPVPGTQLAARFENNTISDIGYYDEGVWKSAKRVLSPSEIKEVTAEYNRLKLIQDNLKSDVPSKIQKLVDIKGSFADVRKGLETNYESKEIGSIVSDVTNWMALLSTEKRTKLSAALDKELAATTAPKEVVVTETEEQKKARRKAERDKERAIDRVGKKLLQSRNTTLGYLTRNPYEIIRKIIPSISREDVKVVSEAQMLRLTEGESSWGFYKNGIIYLLEGAEGVYNRVARHEAFHRIFNKHLTEKERVQLIETAKRINPTLKYQTTLKIEEWLAEEYQNWTTKKGRISLALLNGFKKILKILGLYKANFDNIDATFDAIDAGLLDKGGEVVADTARNLLKIREDYPSTAHYRTARNKIVQGMSFLVNATTIDPKTDKIKPVTLEEDGSNLKEAVPMSFEEALNTLRTKYKRLLKDTIDDLADETDPEEIEYLTYDKEIYEILNDERKSNDLLKDVYPTLYLGKKEFADTLADIDEDLDGKDPEIVNSAEDILEADRVDHEKNVRRSVKDFLATIMDEKGVPVNPRMAFLKVLEAFSGADTRNFETLRKQLRAGFGPTVDTNPKVKAVHDKLLNLINQCDTTMPDEYGNILPRFKKYGFEFRDKDTFVYLKNGTLTTIERGNKTSASFIKEAKEAVDGMMLEKDFPYSTINSLYKREIARETLRDIRSSMGSLRRKNVMMAVRVTTLWDKENSREISAITYRYNSVREQGAKQNIRAAIETAFMSKGDEIPAELRSRFEKTDNSKTKEAIKNIKDFISFLGLGDVTILDASAQDIHASLKDFITQFERVGKEVVSTTENTDDGEKGAENKTVLTWDQLLKDSNERIEKLTDLLAQDTEGLRPVSYTSGDGTKRYEWMNSSFTIDTLINLTRKELHESAPEFLKSAAFRNNSFTVSKDHAGSNTIHSFIDHDSIKEQDNKYKPTPYKGETGEQWMQRNINYTFTALIKNSKVSKGIRYIQQFYTISNKPQTIGAELDLKDMKGIRGLIELAIKQQIEREDFDIDNYDTSKNFLPGIDEKTLVKLKEASNTEAWEDVSKAAIEDVYEGLNKMSDNLAQHLFDTQFVLDYEISKVIKKLLPYIDAKYKNEAGDTLLEQHDIAPKTRSISDKKYNLTKDQLLPLIDLWAKNSYMNGLFLNQLAMGDQAFYKSTADEIKRMSIGFAMGYTGMVNNNGFMNETFKVAVVDKLKFNINDPKYAKYKKLFGQEGEVADAQGYCLPRRKANIDKGFGTEMRLGNTMKPVYWSIDKNGIPRAMKYGLIVLSDELLLDKNGKERFPELSQLRKDMEKADVDELVFHSAFKIGAPKYRTGTNTETERLEHTNEQGQTLHGIDPRSIVELENKNWRIQLNPVHNLEGLVANPTQLTYFVNLNGNNKVAANRLFELNSKLINRGLRKISSQLGKGNGDIDRITKVVASSMGTSDARQHEFLTAKDKDGSIVSINFPTLVNKMVTQIASTVSKASVQVKYNGSKLVLQADYGITFKDKDGKTRRPKFRKTVVTKEVKKVINGKEVVLKEKQKIEYAEVIMDNIYKDQFKVGDMLFESNVGFRIPSTELHSAVPIKIVGFYDGQGTNVVIAPREITIAHGSDYDIDALFIMRRTPWLGNQEVKGFVYKNAIVGRTRGGLKIKNYIPKVEKELKRLREEMKLAKEEANKEKYDNLKITYKILDGALDTTIKNEIVDTFMEVITAERNASIMMTPISMGRLNDVKSPESIFTKLKGIGVDIENQYDLNNPLDQMKIHNDNFSGTALVGAIADLVRGLAYTFQGYTPSKLSLQERIDRIADIPEGKELLESLKGQTQEETLANYEKAEIEKQVAAIEEKNGLTIENPNPVLSSKIKIYYDGKRFKTLERTEYGSEEIVSETLDALINAALDNVKEQILPIINLTNNTGKAYFGMLSTGMPLYSTVLQMLSPAIKHLGNVRNMKFEKDAISKEVSALIEDKYKEKLAKESKEKTANPNETIIEEVREENENLPNGEKKGSLEEYKEGIEINDATVEKLVNKELSQLTLDELIVQEKILNNFKSADRLGEEIGKVSKATKVLKQLPVTQEEIQDAVDRFDDLENVEEPIIPGVNINNIPHIKAARKSLTKVSDIVNNQFYKHRKEINEVAKLAIAKTGITLDKNSNTNKRMVRDEVMKMFISSLSYKVENKDGEFTIDMNTSKEPVKVVNKTRELMGINAFNQRFASDVKAMQEANPDNRFLKALRIAPELGAGKDMFQVVFNTTAALEPVEIQELQNSFNELSANAGEFTKFQHEFVKYAALNQGLNFGVNSYSLLLPVEIYKQFDKEMNNFFDVLLDKDNARQPDVVKQRMKNTSEYFAFKLAEMYPDKCARNNEYVKNPDKPKYPMQGMDTDKNNEKVYYELKYKHEEASKTTQKAPDSTTDDGTGDAQNVGTNDGEKEVDINGFPQFMSLYNESYVRLETKLGDEFIYYQFVNELKKGETIGYEFNRAIMFFGYGTNDTFRRDIKTRSVTKANEQVEYTGKTKYNKFQVGDKINLRNKNDSARIDSVDYEISSVQYLDDNGKVVAVRTEGGTVKYGLIKEKKVLIFDSKKISNEEFDDYKHLC